MYYCKKCNKEVETKKDLYKGLCEKCYLEYLFDKVEKLGTQEYTLEENTFFSIKNLLNDIFEYIKNWRNKK